MDDRAWKIAQVCSIIGIVVIILVMIFFIAEPQGGGNYTMPEPNFLTQSLGVLILACGFVAVLGEVRRRTGELSVKTVLLTLAWFAAIAIFLAIVDAFRGS